MNITPPRYIVNPAAALKPMWFPGIHQMVLDRPNRSYLNSLWIGTGGNLLSLPYRVATEIVSPLFNFRLLYAAAAIALVPLTTLALLVSGLRGRLSGVDVTLEERMDSMLLSESQGQEALAQGCDLVVLDVMMLLAQDAGQLPEGTVIPGHPANIA